MPSRYVEDVKAFKFVKLLFSNNLLVFFLFIAGWMVVGKSIRIADNFVTVHATTGKVNHDEQLELGRPRLGAVAATSNGMSKDAQQNFKRTAHRSR